MDILCTFYVHLRNIAFTILYEQQIHSVTATLLQMNEKKALSINHVFDQDSTLCIK